MGGALTIASLVDGRVVPWFLERNAIPAKYVVVPESLLKKWRSGKIADGKELARVALAQDSTVGIAPNNAATLPPEPAVVVAEPEPESPAPVDDLLGDGGGTSII